MLIGTELTFLVKKYLDGRPTSSILFRFSSCYSTTVRAVKHWNRLPIEAVESACLETVKMEMARDNML